MTIVGNSCISFHKAWKQINAPSEYSRMLRLVSSRRNVNFTWERFHAFCSYSMNKNQTRFSGLV